MLKLEFEHEKDNLIEKLESFMQEYTKLTWRVSPKYYDSCNQDYTELNNIRKHMLLLKENIKE